MPNGPAPYPSFIELPGFLRRWEAIGLSDRDLFELQRFLGEHPEAGAVVKGAGGLRKVRFAPPAWAVGKSGAVRVYYAYLPGFGVILLGSAYAKSKKGELSPAEKQGLAALAREYEDLLREQLREGDADG
jgi:hypothetical protein